LYRQQSKEESLTCPADRQKLDPDRDIFPDKAAERKILSMAIRCPNDGCEWTAELRNKKIHLKSCPFLQVACSNKNCPKKVQRRHLTRHENYVCPWRILQCTYCTEPHPDCMMQDHIRQCSKFPITCPNSCGLSIPRDMISNHTKNVCPLTIISCPYAGMGCTAKIQRQEMEYHLESTTRIHLDLVCIKLDNTEDKLNKTEDELNNTKDKLKKTEDKSNNTEALLNETRLELKNAMEQLNLSSVKHTNVFLWRIDNFSEILKEAKNGGKETIGSDLHQKKLRLEIRPKGLGDSENTHLSVFIAVMKGEYDAILRWPFNKKVKFTVIDQQNDPDQRENIFRTLQGPRKKENLSRGLSNFISHLKLHSRRYIVDDTLFLQVEISQPPDTNSSLED
ncbi:unnamed protein product, partial [Pocillopora meandrina]